MPLKDVKQLRDVQSCPKCYASQGVACRTPTCPQLKFCKKSLGKEMVKDLFNDLSGRSGFGNTIDEMSEEDQKELMKNWEEIAANYMKNA